MVPFFLFTDDVLQWSLGVEDGHIRDYQLDANDETMTPTLSYHAFAARLGKQILSFYSFIV